MLGTNSGHGDFSCALWLRLDALPGRIQQVVHHAGKPELQITADGHAEVFFDRFCGHIASRTALQPERWYFLAVVRADGRAVLYLDGEREGAAAARDCDCSSAAPLVLGGDGDFGEPFSGALDDVTFWSRALSETEVVEWFRSGSVDLP